LVTYNQGRKDIAPQAPGDKYIRLWALVSPGNIDHENDVKLNVGAQTISTLYDVFAWDGQIIISAITSHDEEEVAMSSCSLDIDISNLDCTNRDNDLIVETDGYIGLGHTHAQLVIYKPKGYEKFVFIYDMTGNKFGKDWVEKDTEYLIDDNKHRPEEGSYVRDYIGNSNGGVFQFTGAAEKNQQILAHSTILKRLYMYPESTGVFLGRNLLIVTVIQPKAGDGHLNTEAYRLDYPFAVVKAEQFRQFPTNKIFIKVSDKDNSQEDSRVVYHINTSTVTPQVDFTPPKFDTWDGSSIRFPFFESNIKSGNNLRYTVEF
jgi:hypothetical protein